MIFQYRNTLLASPELMLVGIITTIYIMINVLLGLVMIYRGIEVKNYTMLYVSGIFFAGISAWGGILFYFLSILILDVYYPTTIYFLVQGGFLWVFEFLWIVGVSDLAKIKGKKRRNLLIIVGSLFATLEIIYWIAAIFAPDLLGTIDNLFVPDYAALSEFYLLAGISFFTIGGAWIGIESYKSKVPKVKLKSYFLLLYVILITVGSILEIFRATIFGELAIIGSLLAKIVLTAGMFSGYIGFMLPPPIAKIFLDKEEL